MALHLFVEQGSQRGRHALVGQGTAGAALVEGSQIDVEAAVPRKSHFQQGGRKAPVAAVVPCQNELAVQQALM